MVLSPNRKRRNGHRYPVELLEPRVLMSITPTVTSVPDVFPLAGAYNPSDGHLWVFDGNSATLQDLDGTANIDVSSVGFNGSMVITNGHAYLSDFNGGIDDVTLSTGSVAFHQLTTDPLQTPLKLAVTANAIWFTGQGEFNVNEEYTNIIGRWVPGSGSANFVTLDPTMNDSVDFSITANGADSVWVGMVGQDDGVISGTNRLVKVDYSAGFTATQVAVNSGDPIADANNQLNSVAGDGSGGVWYVLAQTPAHDTLRTQFAPETIVHLTSTGAHTAYPVTTDANAVLNVRSLTMGPGNRLWFLELNGPQAGYLNTTTGTYDLVNYPSGTADMFDIAVNPTAAEATVFTAPFDSTGPMVVLQVDTSVGFSGTANDLSLREDTAINSTLLATFTAPALPTGQNYTATVTWGDSTTSTITASALGSNTYAIVVNGKSFATQGNFAGSISIAGPSSSPIGTLTFTSHISDIPLNVSSLAVTPLVLRIATAVGTFTDDGDLPLSTFTATINWGDSSSSTGIIVRDPTQAGRYIVISAHQFRRRGTYAVRLTVSTSEANAAVTNNTITTNVTV